MNKLNLTLTTVVLSLALSTSAHAYGKKKAAPAPAPEAAAPAAPAPAAAMTDQPAQGAMPGMTDEMMAKMKEYMTPNENHAVLNVFVGEWDYSMKWWMAADAKPEETTGDSTAKWIMDGRFLQQDVSGTSMGQPFTGMNIVGYDNANKRYTSIWLDNMGTGVMTATSTYDAATKTFTEAGSHSCPLSPTGQKNYRAVLTVKDNDHYTYEWYTTSPTDPAGKEFKAMEINYTREAAEGDADKGAAAEMNENMNAVK